MYLTINGYLPLRASALECGGKAILLFGIKGSGKSTFLFNMSANEGCKIIGEDSLVINEHGNVWGSLFLSSNLNYLFDVLKILNINNRKTSNVLTKKPSTLLDIVDRDKISIRSNIGWIVFLERSLRNNIVEIPLDEAVERILLLNRGSYTYEQIPITQALSLFMPKFKNIRKKEKEMLQSALRNAKASALIIKSKSPRDSYEMFKSVIR